MIIHWSSIPPQFLWVACDKHGMLSAHKERPTFHQSGKWLSESRTEVGLSITYISPDAVANALERRPEVPADTKADPQPMTASALRPTDPLVPKKPFEDIRERLKKFAEDVQELKIRMAKLEFPPEYAELLAPTTDAGMAVAYVAAQQRIDSVPEPKLPVPIDYEPHVQRFPKDEF